MNFNRRKLTVLLVATAMIVSMTLSAGLVQAKSSTEGTWQTKASLPALREGPSAGQIGNFIYVTHGYTWGDTNANEAYDIDKDVWISKALAPTKRAELTGAVHGGKLYAIGGRHLGMVLSTVEAYDPATDSWTTLLPMPTPRAGLGAAVVGNTIYVIGGRTGTVPKSGMPLNIVEAYDIAHDTWTAKAPMPTARMDVYSTVAHGGKVYVIGGYNAALGGDLNTVEVYDPVHDSWSTLTPMPTLRSNLTAAVKGNTIYAIGGISGWMQLNVVEAYDIDKDTWSLAPSMPTARSELVSVSHGDRIFAIAGGYFGVSVAANEVFRP